MSEKGIRKDQAVDWMHRGIIMILFIAGPMHFAFEGLGRPFVAGAVFPVNESVFEHLKLAFWPLLFWWLLGYALHVRHDQNAVRKWFLAAMSSIVVSPLFIVVFYYTYTGALGIHSLLLDVLSLPISLVVAQLLAVHIYRYSRGPGWSVPAFVAVVAFLIVIFVLFTFQPPRLPLFLDTSTGRYGLN